MFIDAVTYVIIGSNLSCESSMLLNVAVNVYIYMLFFNNNKKKSLPEVIANML